MRLAKTAALAALAGLSLASLGCQSSRFDREFPPRIDRFLVNEFSRSAQSLADSGAMFWDMAARDVANSYSHLTEGIPSYLGKELTERPAAISSQLAQFGNREWQHAKELPSSLWDFLELLIGI